MARLAIAHSTDMAPFAQRITQDRYAHPIGSQKESWREVSDRVAYTVLGAVPGVSQDLKREMAQLIFERKFMPGGRYLYATGSPFHQTNNCLLLRASDSREGWGELMNKAVMALMTGAGIGVVYSDLREKNAPIKRTGGVASGPCALMQMINEAGRGAQQGGHRRAAMWAGLHWNHPDIFEFMRLKQWSEDVKRLKAQDFNFPAPMDFTNISVILDDAFFTAYRAGDSRARMVYWSTVRLMLETGEPGFSVNVGENEGEDLRNACTELTSRTTDDICNVGSVNLARIGSASEMVRVVEVGTQFLLAGTVYSDVPYPDVAKVRQQNRRLGLGLMGMHEWLLQRGKTYGPDAELGELLSIYTDSTQIAARAADRWSLSRPVKTRAIAPTGTISIVAETTSGIEPIFAVAQKRRFLDRGTWNAQFILDPTAKRLVDAGADPEQIEDAYSISHDRRIAFQAWTQKFVDHGIASTINLPQWGSEKNNEDRVQDFGNLLIGQLPLLRGITCYPDGARSGQPLNPVPYREAASRVGETLVEGSDICDITKGGASCGS